ncbi:Hypothetical protein LUCI_0777 [Lucifera butyrica]|uniref:Uncharacterized protein n=1 Tax=Lucifera butyrica TaxID=1351585 RepID=A0A498R3Z2_9FIRM|nr:hypothetical protein [Lucifera butyrica]VBB05567.1 Hypothetical protein LUCI_0777 [Lucifera butyrica]
MATIKLTISAENAQAIAALKQIAGTAVQTGSSIEKAGTGGSSALSQAAGSAVSLGQKLANITIVAGGITMVLNKIKEAAKALIAPGIDFSKQMEISKLGVAGVLMSMTLLNGQALQLPQALAISGKSLDELAEASGRIGLPLSELSETFQAIVGAGLTQKMTMQEIVDFTITGTKAVKTMMAGVGNEGMQIVQELRSMVSGNIDQNSQVARSLGITNADIEKAKQSAGGLFKYLQDKLSGFAEIVKVYPDTLKGKMDRLKTVFQQVSSQGSEPFTELLKEGLDAITAQLLVTETHVTETGETLKTVKLNPELISDFKQVSTYIVGLLHDGANFAVTLGSLASGPASAVLAVIKLILDNAAQVTFTLLAWMAISKLRPILVDIIQQIQYELSIFRMLVATSGAFKATLITTGTVIKSLLVTTGWGILAAAIGYAADQAFKLYENLTKAGKAKHNYFKEKEDSMRPIPEQLEGKLSQPIYNVNSDVNMGGMSQEVILKLEKFIAAINYMFPDREVTVTSGYRDWGGHINGQKADIDVQGMKDPLFRQQLISLGKEFGIAILDEVDGPASDTPEARENWGPHLDLDMNGAGLQTGGQGDLSLKNPKDEAESIAKAKIALAEATEKQELQAYLDGVKSDQLKLDQRRQATKDNLVSDELPAISEADYYKQTDLNKVAQVEVEIKLLETQRDNLQKLATNNNLDGAEASVNLKAQIVEKETEIAQKRNELAQTLQQLGFEEAQAQKDLLEKITDMQAQLLEAQGKTAEAARIRNEKDKQQLITQLKANDQTDAVETVTKLYDIKQAQADFEQLSMEYENYKTKLEDDIAELGMQLSGGNIAPGVYRTKLQNLLVEFDGYTKGIKDKFDALVKVLNDPKFTEQIHNMIPEEMQDHFTKLNDLVTRIQNEEQTRLAALDLEKAQTGMTDLSYDQKKLEIQKQTAQTILNELIPAMDKLKPYLSPDQYNGFVKLKQDIEGVTNQLDPLKEKLNDMARNSLEEFFTTGINECKNLGDAFRNLISSMLSELQRLYAKELASRLYNGFANLFGGLASGLGSGTKTTVNSKDHYADGGRINSGKISGPGTSTSDSILAWVGNARKFIRIANGEFVMRGAAVRKYGVAYLDRLNRGLVPKRMLPAFAAGGSLTGSTKTVQSPQELAASLVNNNSTSIPLKIINVNDPNEVGRYLNSQAGEKVMVNWMKNNVGTVRQILKIRG